jgi:hypothetical protein
MQVAPAWSFDGRWIAWLVGSRDGYRIALFDTDADHVVELATDAAFHRDWLSWSSDSSWLVTATRDLQRLALIRVDRSMPDRYLTTAGRISGVSWQP